MPIWGVDTVEALALELGRKVDSLLMSYLGLPLGPRHNSTLWLSGMMWQRDGIS